MMYLPIRDGLGGTFFIQLLKYENMAENLN